MGLQRAPNWGEITGGLEGRKRGEGWDFRLGGRSHSRGKGDGRHDSKTSL